jgi:hypothetical protein
LRLDKHSLLCAIESDRFFVCFGFDHWFG